MKKTRKLLGIALAIAMVFNTFAIASVAKDAASQDVDNVAIELLVGKYNSGTKVFTPLAPGEQILQNDVITVRVAPQSNFYVGAQNYPVMFDKNLFEVQGEAKAAFTVNTDEDHLLLDDDTMVWSTTAGYTGNLYYDFACTGYAGSTDIPNDAWPATFAAGERYDVYQVIQANFQADSNSKSYGFAQQLPGDWLFQFNLKAKQNFVSGTDARIFMDNRWFRAPASTNLPGYITKYDPATIIAQQSLPSYTYDRDFTAADILLPTEGVITTSTITFVTGGGTVIGPLTGNVGSPVEAVANPTRTNYVFKAWDTDIPVEYPLGDMIITAQWILKGDVNGSGSLQSVDALLALRAYSGQTPLVAGSDAFIAADINGNGVLQSVEALYILRKYSGQMAEWPA